MGFDGLLGMMWIQWLSGTPQPDWSPEMGEGWTMGTQVWTVLAWAGLSIVAAIASALSTWLFQRQRFQGQRLSRLRLLEADNHSLRQDVLALRQLLEEQGIEQPSASRQDPWALETEPERDYFPTVLENMPVMLNAFDPQGNLKLWNHECQRVTGYLAEEMIDNPRAMEWLYPNAAYRQKMMTAWQTRGNDFRDWEWDITCKDGTVKTIAWSNISDRYPICGWSTWSIGVEVSDRKRAEAELREAKEAAEDASKAKSRFLASMSHELRTPLNSILGFSQLINREGALPLQMQEYLDIINRSGEDLLGLINDVLEVSKIEAGRVTLQPAAFDLHKLLQRLEETLSLQAHVKGLRLRFQVDPQAPRYIQADEGKLNQILLNLLGNAIKFTDSGGVVLRVKAPLARKLRFEVQDSGPGIATEDLPELFKPFAQTHLGQTVHKGSGLGLFISQRFVQLMDGQIQVRSRLGRGTLFICDLPVLIVTPAHLAPVRVCDRRIQAIAPGQPRYRILIAEDRPTNRLLLLQILSPLGFEVWQAEHGQEAVEMCQRLHPDLILMDMRMPVMDGYEATRQIQAHFSNQGTQRPKIIALTASAFEEERRQMMAQGCDAFVRKPFNREDLLSLIGTHLDVRYLYEEAIPPTPPSLPQSRLPDLEPNALEPMPEVWRQQLYQAAAQGSDRKLLQLIEAIPSSHQDLAIALTTWVTHYRFDRVMALAQPQKLP